MVKEQNYRKCSKLNHKSRHNSIGRVKAIFAGRTFSLVNQKHFILNVNQLELIRK